MSKQVDTDNYAVPNTSKTRRLNDVTPAEWDEVYHSLGNFTPAQDDNVNKVVESYLVRAEAGMDKYGVTTSANPLDLIEWLTHLQEELMDATVYIERTIEELDKRGNNV